MNASIQTIPGGPRLPKVPAYELPSADEFSANRVAWAPKVERGALLIHDLQQHFVDIFEGGCGQGGVLGPVLDRVVELLDWARRHDLLIIYTAQPARQSPEQRGLLTDMWGPGLSGDDEGAELVAAIAPRAGDVVLTKWRYSAFVHTELEQCLAQHNCNELYITGVYGHIGCAATACDAFMRDIKAFVVRDAIADFSAEHHRAALEYVATRCGAVIDTKALLAIESPSERLLRDVAEVSSVAVDDIDVQADLADLGLDSIRLMAVIEAWSERFDVDPDPGEIASCTTLAQLIATLARAAEEAD